MAVAGGPQRPRRPARVVEGRAQLAEELELERADLVERLDGLRGAVARRGRRLGLRGAGELAIGPGQPPSASAAWIGVSPSSSTSSTIARSPGGRRTIAWWRRRAGAAARICPSRRPRSAASSARLLDAHAGAGLAGTTGTCRSAITAPVTASIQGNGLDRAGS